VAPVDQVGLVPPPGPDADRGWLATFHAAGGAVRVYVDMTTPPVWDGAVLRAVDLDLDVVQGTSGRVWVDDEDEFAEHRAAFGYPADVSRLAMDSCDRVRAAVEAGRAPYDGAAAAWFTRLTGG
jgi:protein associated with RNAse G/E